MKICIKCKQNKKNSDFAFRNKEKGTLQGWCRECKKKADKEYYKSENRKKSLRKAAKDQAIKLRSFIERVKKLSKCNICKEDRHYLLDFHHTKDKKYVIANAAKRAISINTLKKEMRKCIILCANCHRELHYKEKNGL